MMRVSKESPSVARAAQIRCALMRRVAYMACAKHLLLPCIPLAAGCDGRLGVLAPKAAEAPHGVQETTCSGEPAGQLIWPARCRFHAGMSDRRRAGSTLATPPHAPDGIDVVGGPTADECCNVR